MIFKNLMYQIVIDSHFMLICMPMEDLISEVILFFSSNKAMSFWRIYIAFLFNSCNKFKKTFKQYLWQCFSVPYILMFNSIHLSAASNFTASHKSYLYLHCIYCDSLSLLSHTIIVLSFIKQQKSTRLILLFRWFRQINKHGSSNDTFPSPPR